MKQDWTSSECFNYLLSLWTEKNESLVLTKYSGAELSRVTEPIDRRYIYGNREKEEERSRFSLSYGPCNYGR